MCWQSVSSPNSYIKILTLTVSRGGACGRGWGHESKALTNGVSALRKRPQRSLSPLLPHACEEVGSHQTWNLPAPWPWTSQPPELRNKFVVYKPASLGHLVRAGTSYNQEHWNPLKVKQEMPSEVLANFFFQEGVLDYSWACLICG